MLTFTANFSTYIIKRTTRGIISKKIVVDNWEILEIEEEKNSLWFALALAQWDTKSLDPKVLATVEDILLTGADLKIWLDLGASEQDIKKKRQIQPSRNLTKLTFPLTKNLKFLPLSQNPDSVRLI